MKIYINAPRILKNNGDKTTNTTNDSTFPWDIMYNALYSYLFIFEIIKHSPRTCLHHPHSGTGAYWSTIVMWVNHHPKNKTRYTVYKEINVPCQPFPTNTKRLNMLWIIYTVLGFVLLWFWNDLSRCMHIFVYHWPCLKSWHIIQTHHTTISIYIYTYIPILQPEHKSGIR